MGDNMTQHRLFDSVKAELSAVDSQLASVVHSRVDQVTDIGSHLFRAGGKRLRPALFLLCAKGGVSDRNRLISIAMAIELIHTATLIHDDVIDESPTRRGIPTANSRWGNQIPVLAGDYLFARAFSLMALHADNEMMEVLTDAICQMCEGEIVQVRDVFDIGQTENDYLRRIGQKTAEFIAASCKLGGMAAGFDREACTALYRYGHAVGLAFQITDDILDLTAAAEQIGKPAGSDLQQGILTLPVIYALTHSPQREELRELIAAKDWSGDSLKRSLSIIHAAKALEYATEKIDECLALARCILPDVLSPETREALLEVAAFVGRRKY